MLLLKQAGPSCVNQYFQGLEKHMALYESEHTKFMREWLAKHPEQRVEQKNGTALWWDKHPKSRDEQRLETAARVPARPYQYY